MFSEKHVNNTRELNDFQENISPQLWSVAKWYTKWLLFACFDYPQREHQRDTADIEDKHKW